MNDISWAEDIVIGGARHTLIISRENQESLCISRAGLLGVEAQGRQELLFRCLNRLKLFLIYGELFNEVEYMVHI